MNEHPGTVGIVGAGVMGRSIGLRAAQSRLDVRLYDSDSATSQAAIDWIAAQLRADLPRPTPASSIRELSDCSTVIEAVVENRAVKRRVLANLSEIACHALMATNTSSLSIGELAARVEQPERFCGMHFCHPIAECPLVEIVAGPATTDGALDRAESLVRSMRLQPLRTRDVPGFAVNRLLFPYLEAAIALVRSGLEVDRIDHAAVDFGMRLGPLAQMDEIGIDVILRAAAAFHRGNPVVPPQSELLLAMFQAGRLGQKTGRGFYTYSADGGRRVDSAAMEIANEHRLETISATDSELQLRLFVPLFASACELIENRVVAEPSGVRSALIAGLGCTGQAADLAGWARNVTVDVLRDWMQQFGIPAPAGDAVQCLIAE